MGPIGAQLPKVMWPVFEQSLLELQLRFARQLGYENIWINLHHQADVISERTRKLVSFKGVRWLIESPEILDIGGGIHNLAAQTNYDGELLVLNADQFLWFTAEELTQWKQAASDWDVLLLNWQVNSTQGYNQVESDAKRNFVRVIKNAELPRNKAIETYSGNSLINLAGLKPSRGPSAFFDSICNPANQTCKTALLRDGKYWDFGTADRYWNSMREIMAAKARGDEDAFTHFLESTGAFNQTKFNATKLSYGCQQREVIHLGLGEVSPQRAPGVVIEGASRAESGRPCFEFNGLTQFL